MVTWKMNKAGIDIANSLMDASIQSNCGGMGGCKHFNIKDYPEKERDLILRYLKEDIDSVTAIYLAMEREKDAL